MAIASSSYPPEIDAHLWRGFRDIRGKLKLGVMMERGNRAPEWIARLLNLLIAETAVKVDVVYRLAGLPEIARKQDLLFRFLERNSKAAPSVLTPVSVSIKPACCLIDILHDSSVGLTPDVRARIASRQLDVLLWLGQSPLAGDCSSVARLGLWAFHLGDPSAPVSNPPYWREVVSRQHVAEIALLRYRDNFERAEVIASHQAPTQLEWRFTLNAAQPTWMAGPLLIRSFLDALAGHHAEKAARIVHPQSKPVESRFTETLRFTAQRTLHSLWARAG
jgi:hypothetical protein